MDFDCRSILPDNHSRTITFHAKVIQCDGGAGIGRYGPVSSTLRFYFECSGDHVSFYLAPSLKKAGVLDATRLQLRRAASFISLTDAADYIQRLYKGEGAQKNDRLYR